MHGAYPADAFKHTPQPSRLRGGRFDSLAGDYGYTYLGEPSDAALTETLCSDLPVGGPAGLVPHTQLSGRRPLRQAARDALTVAARGSLTLTSAADLATTRRVLRSHNATLG